MPSLSPASVAGETKVQGGGKRGGVSVKKLKRVLKKAGLKTSGKKATLTRRAKKAHLKLRGGAEDVAPEVKEQLGGMVEEIKEEEKPLAGGRRSRRNGKGRKHTRRH
jgi:hypothetical protein